LANQNKKYSWQIFAVSITFVVNNLCCLLDNTKGIHYQPVLSLPQLPRLLSRLLEPVVILKNGPTRTAEFWRKHNVFYILQPNICVSHFLQLA